MVKYSLDLTCPQQSTMADSSLISHDLDQNISRIKQHLKKLYSNLPVNVKGTFNMTKIFYSHIPLICTFRNSSPDSRINTANWTIVWKMASAIATQENRQQPAFCSTQKWRLPPGPQETGKTRFTNSWQEFPKSSSLGRKFSISGTFSTPFALH